MRRTSRTTTSRGGEQGSGKRVEFTSTAVLRIEDGLIAAAWDEVDMLGLMRQLKAPSG